MGVDRSVYLGPYLEYQVKLVERRIDQCRDPEACPNPTEGYCPKCGVSVANRFIDAEVEDPGFDIFELTEDALAVACSISDDHVPEGVRVHQVVPNRKREGRSCGRYFDAQHEESAVDMSNQDPQDELDWFVRTFAPEIEKVRALVGRDNLKICWGVLIYFW